MRTLQLRTWTTAAFLALGLTGCGLLDTEQPDIIQGGGLETPEGAEARRAGAIRDFVFAKDGDGSQNSTEGLLVLTGDMSDEFQHSGFIPSTVEFDQRLLAVNNAGLEEIWSRLHRARVAAETAADALQRLAEDPSTNTGIPETLSLAGYTYLFFAEDFCSGVPYSSIQDGKVIPGGSVSTDSSLALAIARFDSALASPAAAVDPDIQYLAQVGKARALLFRGQFAAAAAEVAAVPTTFAYHTEHAGSPLSLANAVWVYGVSGPSGGSISMADAEGGNGLPFRAAADPRVPFFDTGHTGLDQTTPQYDILKYPDISSPVALADGIEARLIEAEAQLQSHDSTTMTATLNAIRAAYPDLGLAPLAVPGSRAAAENLLFQERAFWLYATGHRLADLRRLVRQYGRAANTVYPEGAYLRGGSYGTRVSFPVPTSEDQNPGFDRSACNPDVP
ncbi:MAG TPA: hypothetical protein VG692_08290 [Gemmatimonadales bacterium]|nr:hypothetical protein [Gemmatimonadales bacterium]